MVRSVLTLIRLSDTIDSDTNRYQKNSRGDRIWTDK